MGEKIRMIIDCDSHKAYFERGDDWMGIAFKYFFYILKFETNF